MHTEVQQDAAVFYSHSEMIDAPISLLYDIISDVAQWPAWQSSVNRTYFQGTCHKGKEFKWHSSGMAFKGLVHTANPPLEFGWVARSMWFKVVFNWSLEERDGQVMVTSEESLSGLGAEFLTNTIKSNMQFTLMELKKYAESLALVGV